MRWTTNCILAAVIVAPSSAGESVKGDCAPESVWEEDTAMMQKKHRVVMSDESAEEAALDAAAEAELLKQEAAAFTKFKDYPHQRDLSQQSPDSYLAIDRTASIQDNVEAAFDHFMSEHTDIRASFNDAELAVFLSRVVDRVEDLMKQNDQTPETVSNDDWVAWFGATLQSQKPVVTQAIVEQLNDDSDETQATYDEWMSYMTQEESDRRNGLVFDEENAPPSPTELRALRKESIKRRLRNKDTSIPTAFNSATNWPNCADVIYHVRDQGNCGSCWAFAAATAADGMLCIATNGQFSGSNSYISAGYLTSCAYSPSGDGCEGGFPAYAIQHMGYYGAPTGFGTNAGCTPYFAAGGDATQHMNGGNMVSPSCPSSCGRASYPRSMANDMFRPTAWSGVSMRWGDLDALKSQVMSKGPTPAYVWVNDYFSSVGSYIWNPPCNYNPNHAVTMYGWDRTSSGTAYVLMINSYGTNFGFSGHFAITECGVQGGDLVPAASSSGLPLPLPGDDSPAGGGSTGWTLVSGQCTIDNAGCASSPNYPNYYQNNQACQISTGSENGAINVISFNTERWFDHLNINGRDYNGYSGPQGVVAAGTISWSSDYSVTRTGWKICPR